MKFLVVIISMLSFIAARAEAQGFVFVAQDTPQSQGYGREAFPEVLVHIPPTTQDNVIFQNASFVDNTAQNTAPANNETEPENISYYVPRLNLTAEQMNRAQELNNASHIMQEQLLQSIETLRQQAHELERNSLTSFEAILTEDQKNEFSRLRAERENAQAQPEVQPDVQPTPQPEYQPEVQPDVQPAPQPEYQPEVQPDVQPAPQPEYQPEVQPDVQPTPQPEYQPEVQPDVQPAPQPEYQPEVQ